MRWRVILEELNANKCESPLNFIRWQSHVFISLT